MVIKVELICIPFHVLILFIAYLCNLVRSFRWQLSQTIKPSSFTLEHMPASLSQFGDNSIPSAPKDFSVWVSECHSNTENISRNTPCLLPNILHNRAFFVISPGYYSSQEKLKSMLMQTFGEQTGCITGDVQRRTSYLITVCVE